MCPRCGTVLRDERIPLEGWCPVHGPVFIGQALQLPPKSIPHIDGKARKKRLRSLAPFTDGVTSIYRASTDQRRGD